MFTAPSTPNHHIVLTAVSVSKEAEHWLWHQHETWISMETVVCPVSSPLSQFGWSPWELMDQPVDLQPYQQMGETQAYPSYDHTWCSFPQKIFHCLGEGKVLKVKLPGWHLVLYSFAFFCAVPKSLLVEQDWLLWAIEKSHRMNTRINSQE